MKYFNLHETFLFVNWYDDCVAFSKIIFRVLQFSNFSFIYSKGVFRCLKGSAGFHLMIAMKYSQVILALDSVLSNKYKPSNNPYKPTPDFSSFAILSALFSIEFPQLFFISNDTGNSYLRVKLSKVHQTMLKKFIIFF